MTKGELVKLLEPYPNDMDIVIEAFNDETYAVKVYVNNGVIIVSDGKLPPSR